MQIVFVETIYLKELEFLDYLNLENNSILLYNV
nr:MAG TPA: hypothetical protein [Caudoviricetes sp.]DAY42086.1 MAG TPA: hypothetical protein [Caudoviricetes sp.]